MQEHRDLLNNLIPLQVLMNSSGEEIVNEIAMQLYKEQNHGLTEKDTFYKLPLVIRDVILLINLDTELNMQGILGFLENSTGLFLDDTIETLEGIRAEEDCQILKTIRSILESSKVTVSDLRANVNRQEEFSISSFFETHGPQYGEMADRICEIADELYVHSEDRNVFDSLIKYVDHHKTSLIEELTR